MKKAVAPVIATLLLVAIAVIGGSIIFVFSQGFFSTTNISIMTDNDYDDWYKKTPKLDCYTLEYKKRPYDVVVYDSFLDNIDHRKKATIKSFNQWFESNNKLKDFLEECRLIDVKNPNSTQNEVVPMTFSNSYGKPSILKQGMVLQQYIMIHTPYNEIKPYVQTVKELSDFYYMNEKNILEFERVNNNLKCNPIIAGFSYYQCDLLDKQYFWNDYQQSFWDKNNYIENFCKYNNTVDKLQCIDDLELKILGKTEYYLDYNLTKNNCVYYSGSDNYICSEECVYDQSTTNYICSSILRIEVVN